MGGYQELLPVETENPGGKEDYSYSCQLSAVTGLALGLILPQNCTYDLYVAVLGLVGSFSRKLKLECWDLSSEEKGGSGLLITIFKVGRPLEISD